MEPFLVQIDCLLAPRPLPSAVDILLMSNAMHSKSDFSPQIPLQKAKHSSTSQVSRLVPSAQA